MFSKNSRDFKGSLYAILSGLAYGAVGYFGVMALKQNLSISNMLFWRFLIGSLFLFVLIKLKREPLNIKALLHDKNLIVSAVFYTLTSGTYFISSQLVGTGIAMVLFFTYPIFVILSNTMFGVVKVQSKYYIAASIVCIGLVLLIDWDNLKLDLFGILIGLLSAALYGLYIVISEKIKASSLETSFLVSLGASLTALLFALLEKTFVIPLGSDGWLPLIILGILCSAIPVLLLLESVKYISTEKASILSVLEPVFVVLLGVWLLGETITPLQYVGVATILGGSILTLIGKKEVE